MENAYIWIGPIYAIILAVILHPVSYCFLFERKSWKAWKTAINDFDSLFPGKASVSGQRFYKLDSYGNMEYYVFRDLINDTYGVFDKDGKCIACGSDAYHHKIIKKLFNEKYPINNGQ